MKKNPLKSKTLWGIATMVASSFGPLILAKAGVVDPAAQSDVISAIGTLAGAALGVYGRVKAG
jgi:hypothetical protein